MKKMLRIYVLSLLIYAAIGVAGFIAAGVMDVPSNSPLADTKYVIQPLYDPAIRVSDNLHPELTSINQLNGGEDVAGWTLCCYAAVYVIVIAISVAASRSKVTDGAFLIAGATIYAAKVMAEIIANVAFYSSYLRSDAQTLIDNSHRCRVVIAYIMSAMENWDMKAENVIAAFLMIIGLAGLCIAVIIDFIITRKRTAHKKDCI